MDVDGHYSESDEDPEFIPPYQESSSSVEASDGDRKGAQDSNAENSGTNSPARIRILKTGATSSESLILPPSLTTNPLKRKSSTLSARKTKSLRLSGQYCPSYLTLFNSHVLSVTSPTHTSSPTLSTLQTTQIGLSVWTSSEKEAFFTALDRLGKDAIEEIASRMGTKSAVEVREYVLLLQRGFEDVNRTEERHGNVSLTDVPAAVQISRELEAELDVKAESLALRVEVAEEATEERRWARTEVPWLLDGNTCDWVEEQLGDEEKRKAVLEKLPSVELLDLGKFLELSRRVFMNAAPLNHEENWNYIIDADDEEPAIRTTAFEDLYNLVVSLTKRLLSATIFCALSRLRVTDAKSGVVNSGDVQAAIKILGLTPNSDEFWINCPRRCCLNITYRKKYLSHDEVEAILRGEEEPDSSAHQESVLSESFESPIDSETDIDLTQSLTTPHTRSLTTEYLSQLSPPSSPASISKSTSRSTSHPPPSPTVSRSFSPSSPSSFSTTHQTSSLHRKNHLEALHRHHHASLHDIQASLFEEKRLWETVIKKKPPFEIDLENQALVNGLDGQGLPRVERKGEEELSDWRERRYVAEWEVFERPVDGKLFKRGTRGRGVAEVVKEGGDKKGKGREIDMGDEMVGIDVDVNTTHE